MPNPKIHKRSNDEIIDFINGLPGGNTVQYAKLLNTTAIRISGILKSKEGRKLVKAGRIRAAERGLFPTWAVDGVTERGSLRATDVDNMSKNGLLPKFITDMLNKVHPEFRDDTLNFFKEALEQAAGKVTFETQMRFYVDQTTHYTNELVETSNRLEARSRELERLEHMLDRSMGIAARAVDARALTFGARDEVPADENAESFSEPQAAEVE